MKFWKGNRLDGEFSWPVDAVADAFMTRYRTEKLQYAPLPLERMLRDWLTARDGFNSVWEAETGPDSFEALYALVRERAMAEPPAGDPGPVLLQDGTEVKTRHPAQGRPDVSYLCVDGEERSILDALMAAIDAAASQDQITLITDSGGMSIAAIVPVTVVRPGGH